MQPQTPAATASRIFGTHGCHLFYNVIDAPIDSINLTFCVSLSLSLCLYLSLSVCACVYVSWSIYVCVCFYMSFCVYVPV